MLTQRILTLLIVKVVGGQGIWTREGFVICIKGPQLNIGINVVCTGLDLQPNRSGRYCNKQNHSVLPTYPLSRTCALPEYISADNLQEHTP